jgi:hypothetical protein
MRCLEKRPADRWRNGEELLRRLDGVAAPAGDAPAAEGDREPVERTFALNEDVCRRLDRATLDPRMIGDVLHYLDDEVDSRVLLCLVHGTGYDQRQFAHVVQRAPYRALAPTFYGFEPGAARRSALPLDDHLVILREFARDAVERLRPHVVLLVGFSSGADVGLRLAGDERGDAREARPLADGVLALGANVSLETCFVTRLLRRMDVDDPRAMVEVLRSFGAGADTLNDWLNIHEYSSPRCASSAAASRRSAATRRTSWSRSRRRARAPSRRGAARRAHACGACGASSRTPRCSTSRCGSCGSATWTSGSSVPATARTPS